MSTLTILINTLLTTYLSATSSPVKSPTISPIDNSDTGNIKIRNYDQSTIWYYACTISGLSEGYIVTKVEVQKANGHYYQCNDESDVWKCLVDTALPDVSTAPMSIRLSAGLEAITGHNVINSFTNGLIFDFGSNFAKELEPTPKPTYKPVPTASPTDPTPRPTPTPTPETGDDAPITIRNRAGCTSLWYAVEISGVPSGLSITKVYMQHAGIASNDEWVVARYYEWGNYYAFNENGPFVPPFSFKITASNGETIVSKNVMASLAENAEGEMDQSFSSSNKSGDENKGGISWVVWLVIAIVILVIIGVVIGVVICKKKKQGKGYQSDTLELRENDGNKDNAMNQKKKLEMITSGGNDAGDGDADAAAMMEEIDGGDGDDGDGDENMEVNDGDGDDGDEDEITNP